MVLLDFDFPGSVLGMRDFTWGDLFEVGIMGIVDII